MSLKLNVRQAGDVTVIDLSGKLTLGEGSMIMGDSVRLQLSQGHKKILLNLSDVSQLDSAGLGELIGGSVAVSKVGGALKLTSLTKRTMELMHLTKCHSVFDIFDDEAQAIASFG